MVSSSTRQDKKVKEFWYDNGKICCYIKINDTGVIIDTAPVLKKFINQKVENLISWTNQNFRYCVINLLYNK